MSAIRKFVAREPAAVGGVIVAAVAFCAAVLPGPQDVELVESVVFGLVALVTGVQVRAKVSPVT